MKEMKDLYSRLEAGEESEAPGLLEQWLREGKLSEDEALNEAVSTFTVGVDTVSSVLDLHAYFFTVLLACRLRTRVYFFCMSLPGIKKCSRSYMKRSSQC